MTSPEDEHLCWDWNPSKPTDLNDATVTGLAPGSSVAARSIPARSAPSRSIPEETVGAGSSSGCDLRVPFTLHHPPESAISLDPDATMGVFAGGGGAPDRNRPGVTERGDSDWLDDGPTVFPEVGDGIAGFRLISELGRGAFGRVFLAEESLLGDRLVALKITRAAGDEPRLLARLQHTHIVPIHSVRDDPVTGLRVMCMPYVGGANLAQVLDTVASSRDTPTGPRNLLRALDIVGRPRPSEAMGAAPRHRSSTPASAPRRPPEGEGSTDVKGASSARPAGGGAPGPGAGADPDQAAGTPSMPRWSLLSRLPRWSQSFAAATPLARVRVHPDPISDRDLMQPARRFLRQANFVRAAAWIIARLAEGLEHAHLHGLLHRDLKPSNILISADGTPMLLDFNLAAEVEGKVTEGDRARMGGTLPYMAPEHLDAFHPNGTTRPEEVDERSDIYSLGLILFEMIAGDRPFAEPEPNRPILDSIRTMIDERRGGAPALRSINPGVPPDLDAVVRKCLHPAQDRRYARAGDLAEDLRRFLDDLPLKYATEPTWRGRLIKWLRRNPRAIGASTVGLVGLALMITVSAVAWSVAQHLRVASARLRLKEFEVRFPECQSTLYTMGGPAQSLGRGITLAEETLAQAGIALRPDEVHRPDGWLDVLPLDEQRATRSDLAEVILLLARARVFLADRTPTGPHRRQTLELAVAWLDRAEQIDPHPTQTLFDDRAGYRAKLGDRAGAARDGARAAAIAPSTGRDFYLLGTSLLARGEPDRAEVALIRAATLTPQAFWPYFALGLCHFDQKRYGDAAGDFTVCSVLSPRFAWPWMNRGLALAHANRLIEARFAYDRAVETDGTLADAWSNRGLVALELGDLAAAVEDLQRAIELGRRDINVQASLGEALGRLGRYDEALRLLDHLIAQQPDAILPRIARGTLRTNRSLAGAEEDFRRILAINPEHAAAWLGLAELWRKSDPRESLRLALVARRFEPGLMDAIELCAWLRGSLGEPEVEADVDLLIHRPTASRLYNAACSLALFHRHHPDAKRADRAIELLHRALQSGFSVAKIRSDPDLASLHSHPSYQAMLAGQPPSPPAGPPAAVPSPPSSS